jgi:hypothetical protein
MRDYKHLTRFPGSERPLLEAATKATGLSVNQIIVQSVRQHLPTILAQHQARNVDLSPLPESAISAAYRELSADDLAADQELGRASLKAQRA